MPDNNQIDNSFDIEKIMAEAINRAQPKVAQEWSNVIDKGLAKFDSRAQDIIQKVSGGNPFVESALNTTLQYSKQQIAWFWMKQISKYNGTI